MGVIKKPGAKVGLFETSSEESLHIPQQSDDDCSVASLPVDEHIAPVNGGAVPRHRLPVPTWHGDLRRNFGKKRLRRRENVNQLMTLMEEEELREVTIEDLVPTTRRGFVHILSDETAYKVWHDFIQSSEETQEEILQRSAYHQKDSVIPPASKQLSGDEAFQNIKSGLRNKLKKSPIPQGMLDYLEKNLVDFFTQTPAKTYISESISSFERLLLHAISQYHRLISQSVDSEPEKLRLVQVYNPYHVYQLPEILLGQYLVSRRKPVELTHS